MKTTTEQHIAAAARFASEAQKAALVCQALAMRGDVASVVDQAAEAAKLAGDAVGRLQAAGVPAQTMTGIAPSQADALTELALMDSPDVRALLEAVQALVPLAERIDKSRGHWYEGAPDTDTKGTGHAETLHLLACQLHLEAFGPNTGKE